MWQSDTRADDDAPHSNCGQEEAVSRAQLSLLSSVPIFFSIGFCSRSSQETQASGISRRFIGYPSPSPSPTTDLTTCLTAMAIWSWQWLTMYIERARRGKGKCIGAESKGTFTSTSTILGEPGVRDASLVFSRAKTGNYYSTQSNSANRLILPVHHRPFLIS